MAKTVVQDLHPSTGYMHIGNLRTAHRISVAAAGGKFILRIGYRQNGMWKALLILYLKH